MNWLGTDFGELSARLTVTMTHFLWQGASIAIAVAAVAWLLRFSSAAVRYRVYVSSLFLMAACPPATWFSLGRAQRPATFAAAAPISGSPGIAITSPAAPVGALPVESSPIALIAPAISSVNSMPAPGEILTSNDHLAMSDSAATAAPTWKQHAPRIAMAYGIGVALMLARLLAGLRGGRNLRRGATPIIDEGLRAAARHQSLRLGLRRCPAIGICGRVAVPIVVGIVRPMVLLPAVVIGEMSTEQIEAILAHELAHIRRADPLVQLVQRLIECVLFFHPAVWFISRRIYSERENCCDDLAAAALGSPTDYARSLLRVAELCLTNRSAATGGAVALAAANHPSSLRGRITRLVQGPATPQVRVTRVWVPIVVALISIGSMTAWYRHGAARAEDQPVAATEFTATLVDEEGRPVSRGRISADTVNVYEGIRSDVSGKFTLRDIPKDKRRFAAYSQRMQRMALFTVPAKPPATPQKIILSLKAAEADGRVVDGSGHSIVKARVRLFVTDADGQIYHLPHADWTETDDNGYYSTSQIPSGPGLNIHATISDSPDERNRSESLSLSGQRQIELPDIIVREPRKPSGKPAVERIRFSGRVIDPEGRPIAGAELELEYPKNRMSASGGALVTDHEGRFSRLMPPDATNVTFRLTHPEFVSYHFDERPAPSLEALRDGSAVLVMKPGLTISGTVRDAAGKPVYNALVAAGPAYSSTAGPEYEIIEDSTSRRTAADGTFRIGGIPEGPHSLLVLTDDYAPLTLPIDVHSDMPPIQCNLEEGVSYSAQIVDGGGKPIIGATVAASEWEISAERYWITRFGPTDADGRFTLLHLPKVGKIRLYTKGKNVSPSVHFSWAAGAEDNRSRITLYDAPVINGTVVDAATGQPVTEFVVHPGDFDGDRFERIGFNPVARVKDARGKFSLKIANFGGGETPGAFAGRVVANGFYPKVTPKVYPGKPYEPFDIRLQRGTPISGTVWSLDGQPVSQAIVWFVEDQDAVIVMPGAKLEDNVTFAPWARAKTDATGHFDLPFEKPGRILILHDSGYAIVEQKAFRPEVPTKLTPWARVTGMFTIGGKLVNARSIVLAPVERPRNPAERKSIDFSLRATTGPDGRFTLDQVPSIPLMLAAMTDAGMTGGIPVDPKPGETLKVNLGQGRHSASGHLDFTTVGQAFKPEDVRLRAFRCDPALEMPTHWNDPAGWAAMLGELPVREPSDNSPAYSFAHIATVDRDGGFTFSDLDAGRYVTYIDIHAPRPPNQCGSGMLLATGKVQFDVHASGGTMTLPGITLENCIHPNVGQAAPEIDAKTFDGEAFSLASLRGKFVLINFWASWCGPCMDEIPRLKSIADKHASNPKFVMIGGNVDWRSEAAMRVIREKQLTARQLALGALEFDNPTCRAYGIAAVPSVWLIGPDGKVIAKDLSGVAIELAVAKALDGAK